MKVYVLIEIYGASTNEPSTEVLGVYLNEGKAKKEADRRNDEYAKQDRRNMDCEVLDFDLADVDDDNFYAFTVGT